MAAEAYQNIAAQVSTSLARRLDARMDAERGSKALGSVTRSDIISAALQAFLADTPDPKAVQDKPASAARGTTRRPAPPHDLIRHPAIRTRTRRIVADA